MMKRFLRIASFGCVLLLAGCSALRSLDSEWIDRLLATPTPAPVTSSTSTPLPTSATDTYTETPQPAVTEPMVLRVWLPSQFNPNTNTTAAALLKQRLASFTAEHPGLEIDVRLKSETGEADLFNSLAITSMAAPAALPDVIALPRPALESAAQKNLVQPLSEFPIDDWYPYARELGRVEGITYGIPFAGDALVIIYRPELVWIKTWDGILLSESQLIFAGSDPQAQVGLALYVSAGGDLQDANGKPTLERETLTQVLDLFARGRSAGIFPDASRNIVIEDQVMQEYRSRRAEMVIAHYSQFRPSQDGLVQPLMGLTPDEHLTLATGWVWSVAAQTPERQQLSVELIHYLMADDFLSQWTAESGYLPTHPSALTGEDDETPASVIRVSRLLPSNNILFTLGPIMQEAVVRVLNGEQPEAVSRSVLEKLK